MMNQNIKNKIDSFLKQKQELTEELKKFVADKSYPLQDRWELFINSKLGKTDWYYWDFESLSQAKYHADQEKYQTCYVEDVIEWAEDEYTEKDINEFKEEALKEFIYSWVFDW